MEWLGAEGAEVLRMKTPGEMHRRDDANEYDDGRSEDDRYDSDVTDDYRSEDEGSGDWSNSYGSDEYSSDVRSRYDGENYGQSDDYEEDYSDDIAEEDDDIYSDGFDGDGNRSMTSGEGNVYKDDFEGADDPNDLLNNAFGGPNEPQRYVGDGLGRVSKKVKKPGKKVGESKAAKGKSNPDSREPAEGGQSAVNDGPASSASKASATKEEMDDNQYEEDQYEDEFESEEVLSKKTSLQNEKAGLAKPPPQDHFGMERPTSQKIGKRPASRSQLDSKQSATSSVGMNHQEMTQTLKRHNKNAASHEQLAFMGRETS